MTKRSTRYFAIKRAERILGREFYQFRRELMEDLTWYGRTGFKEERDENGLRKIRPMTLHELMTVKNQEDTSEYTFIQ